MRSAVLDLAWYQYFLLDVIAVLALAVVCIIVSLYLMYRTIFRRLISHQARKNKNTLKKND
jgi:hypothetical protein